MLTEDFSKGLPDLRTGIYRHYKGHFYFVFGYGHDANADDLKMWNKKYEDFLILGERAVVIYMPLELVEGQTGPRLAIRTAEDFFALVGSECGEIWECSHDKCTDIQRFQYMGPAWYGWPRTEN